MKMNNTEQFARYLVHYLPENLKPERGSSLQPYMDAIEKALNSAPAVPELKDERLWGICMAYEKGVCVGSDGTDLPDPYPEGSNDSRAYRYGLQVGKQNRENKIAAAPQRGGEHG